MQSLAATEMRARPFNQKIRIAMLRACFVAVLPLMIFAQSQWQEGHWMFETLENIGIFMIIGAVLGRFWAILYIGACKNRTVMDEGPYSMCRHPLYLFSTIGAAGFGLMLGSIVLCAIFGGLAFLILSATAAKEEAFLRQEFGPAYAAYATRVPRILPKPSLFHAPPTVTSSIRALRVNFADALVFLAFIPLAELMDGIKDAGLVPTFPVF